MKNNILIFFAIFAILLASGCGFVSTIAGNAWAAPMKFFSAPVGLIVNGDVESIYPNHYILVYDEENDYHYAWYEVLLYEIAGIPVIPFSFFADSFDAFKQWGVLKDFGVTDESPTRPEFYGRQSVPIIIQRKSE